MNSAAEADLQSTAHNQQLTCWRTLHWQVHLCAQVHKGLPLPVGTSVCCSFQGATGHQAPRGGEGTTEGALSLWGP